MRFTKNCRKPESGKVSIVGPLLVLFSLLGGLGFAKSSFAEASGSESLRGKEAHGGKAVVCRAADGSIKSAELLDFYEARILYGYNLNISSNPVEDQIAFIEKKFKQLSGGYTDSSLTLSWFKFLPVGQILTATDDALNIALPINCQLGQVASFVSPGKIFIDSEIWQALDVSNRAGLIMHESIYANERSIGANDSRNTRYIVGQLFSENELQPVWQDIPDPVQVCLTQDQVSGISGQTAFAVYTDSNGIQTAQFMHIAGNLMIEKTQIKSFFPNTEFPNLKWPLTKSGALFKTTSEYQSAFSIYIEVIRKILTGDSEISARVASTPYPNNSMPKTKLLCYTLTKG